MMDPAPPRSQQERKQDALNRLEHDVDAWVATADPGSETPYLVPLSFLWDGSTLLLATPAASPTGRNLQAIGKVRVGIGPTRDVVLIEGTVDTLITDAGRLDFLSTTMIFGTPIDVTLSELALEFFFPANARTVEILRLSVGGC